MADLFTPLTQRGVTFRNRIGVSPMCMYSSDDGFATDWHLVHLGTRAVGGAGMVMFEATAVEARGRISPQDLGLWKDEHIDSIARATHFIKEYGAVAGIQLAHAGRKAGVARPWEGGKPVPLEQGGWIPVAPSAIPFAEGYFTPHELSLAEIQEICDAFVKAAHRAERAGLDLLEVHAAHGYLINEFLSPISNRRTDEYGGSFENRARLLLEIVVAIRAFWDKPLWVRISATDWHPDGWTPEDSARLGAILKDAGVDLVDCSSGGNVAGVKVPVEPGYQVHLAETVRIDGGIETSAVGLITTPEQADAIVREGKADIVLLAREMLRDPYWAQTAAKALGQPIPHPQQYHRAF